MYNYGTERTLAVSKVSGQKHSWSAEGVLLGELAKKTHTTLWSGG